MSESDNRTKGEQIIEKEQMEHREKQEKQEQVKEKTVPIEQYELVVKERDELIDKLKRAHADLQNFRKRVANERKELIDRTELNTIETYLFPLIDDLDRALQAAVDHGYDENDPLFHGVKMVLEHAFKMLNQQNIEPIDALGKQFDPLFHEAIMEQATDAVPEKTVLQVVSRGYTQNGKTIRPAKVIVAKALEENNQQDENKDKNKKSEHEDGKE